ncbi:UNVERIFIED_CONTAM: Retrovirus-related Pol polyprotein from transposon.6 [Sesamum radiatum]|uniref:Retrovirus-related Pol polyprotein from transposon.6 n=1 Tax=Sesamum radiatum TaxID=300843 RepID=A0AAW2L549_SESRA
MAHSERSPSPHHHSHSFQQDFGAGGSQGQGRSIPKIEFLKFDGEEPRSWIRKCIRYFHIVHTIPEDQKVSLASVHLDGKAELWYQGLTESRGMLTWPRFMQAVYERIDSNDPGMILGEFTRLQQHLTDTVERYMEKFEELKSHVMIYNSDFPESFYITCFVNGLRQDIRGPVLASRPEKLHQAMTIAKHQQDMVEGILKRANNNSKTWQNNKAFTTPKSNRAYTPIKPTYTPHKSTPLSPSFHPKTIEFSQPNRKILTHAEMQERRSKNLCYNCDEIYKPGHKCKHKALYCIISEDAAMEFVDQTDPQIREDENVSDMSVSLNAMSGNMNLNTLRVKGIAYKSEIHVLIDSGSTHCFIDEDAAVQLGCQLEGITPVHVSVADDSKLVSRLYCPEFSWEMQGHIFSYPVRTLRLGGCHMVLGGNWLRKHSPVEFDYDKMSVTVTRKDIYGQKEKVELQALTSLHPPQLHMISAKSMSKLLLHDSYGFVGHLCFPPTGRLFSFEQTKVAVVNPEPENSPELLELLDSFGDIFQEPTELPPRREIEHQILLKTDVVPKKMAPYRYSYVQKGEIESIVKGLLEAGIVRHSKISFGAPVLLVKKKDGTWRMCVDYRHLNTLTVKHNFPIPIIDELLDELHGACFFFKIDLRSGYFQIRMKDDDVHKTSFVTHQGHYEFLVMPFRLLRHGRSIFNNCILLTILRQHQLYAKRSKSDFGKQKVEYLGHIITPAGLATDPAKVECMRTWPTPSDVRALRGFLGLTGLLP